MLAGADQPFVTFGVPHLTAIALTVVAGAVLPLWVRAARSAKVVRSICWTFAAVMVVNELVWYATHLATQPMDKFLRESLPLFTCQIAVFLTAWTLWRGAAQGLGTSATIPRQSSFSVSPFSTQQAYELAFFWGLGGALQGIITPDLSEGFPSPAWLSYFITHCCTAAGVLVATLGLRFRPVRGAVLRIAIITNLYMLVIAGVNWMLGANYMFLSRAPSGASPMFFLPWPWYILFLELVGAATCLLLYAPFFAMRRRWRA